MNILYTLDLKCFCIAADELNITRAAGRIHLTQQALSSKIARLEQAYGAQFFERLPHLRLTPAGERFLEYARNAVAPEERIAEELSVGADGGLLSFGITPSRSLTCLPRILPAFLEQNKNVRVKLEIRSAGQLLKKLTDGDLDLIFCVKQNENEDILMTPVMTDEMCLAIPRAFFSQYGEDGILEGNPTPHELLQRCGRSGFLAKLPYVLTGPSARRIALTFLHQYMEAPRIILELYHTETIFTLPFSSLGATFMFSSMSDLVARLVPKGEELIILPLGIPEAQHIMVAAASRKRPISTLLKSFIALARKNLN